MPSLPLVTIKELKKQYGKKMLFKNLSFVLNDKVKMGLIGPNGAGKSSLLKVIAGITDADSGDIQLQKNLRVSYIAQSAAYPAESTPLQLALEAASKASSSESEKLRLAHQALGELEVAEIESPIGERSGGQLKRIQIALGLSSDPDLLLLDEPTNHLDIGSILLLEKILSRSNFSWMAISHDRSFLNNTADSIAEINPVYEENIFVCKGNYNEFLKRKEEYLLSDIKQKESLQSKVRVEEAWLKQGAKARSTKSKGRTESAHELIDTLKSVKSRQRERKVRLQFSASERKTKELATFQKVSKSFPGAEIFKELSLKIIGGQALGVLGLNGSGKSTFVKLLSEELEPDSGNIKRATGLNISHFRQFEADIENETLQSYLAGETDSVVFQGKIIHVSSWASRFQFSFDQLVQPFNSLSGGEKSRARIARLMLETPDILILDEPTNDLDIDTLEILEESLSEFKGALILVSHDRTLINNLCSTFLGLDGEGGAKIYADYKQWEKEVIKGKKVNSQNKEPSKEKKAKSKSSKKKLTYNEQREYAEMEKNILKLEEGIEKLEAEFSSPETQSDKAKLQETCLQIANSKQKLEDLYSRWEELEGKIS